jgi:hypothetical protein
VWDGIIWRYEGGCRGTGNERGCFVKEGGMLRHLQFWQGINASFVSSVHYDFCRCYKTTPHYVLENVFLSGALKLITNWPNNSYPSVLCCVVLCGIVLCCVVSCCVMWCCMVMCCVMLCGVVLCCVTWCCVVLCYVVLCCVVWCYVMWQCVVLCGVVLCRVMLCCVMWCCVMLCSFVLYCLVTMEKMSNKY